MAKIAALLLPGSRADDLSALIHLARDALSLSPDAVAEIGLYHGRQAACGLLRVGPDLINRAPQPLKAAEIRQ